MEERQATHNEIAQALGRVEGELTGMRRTMRTNGETAATVASDVKELRAYFDGETKRMWKEIGSQGVWQAEVRGAMKGAWFAVAMLAGVAGAVVGRAADWAIGKFG